MATRKDALAVRAAEEAGKPVTVSDGEREYLDKVYARLRPPASADAIDAFSEDFRAQLERCRRDAEQGQRVAAAEIQAAISIFTSRWPDSAPDNSGDVDRCGADFAALHEEITRRRLPEAMHRFQTMISEDMVPSVSVVYRTIETAAAEIRRRADMVNVGLKRVEFNQGTHLQIAVNAHQFESVRQFRSAVDDLLKNAPAARATPQQALAQFTRVRDLMARFTGDDPEHKRWRETVLDVRLAFSFYGREEDCDGVTIHTYRNTAAGSGGEQEKLVAFCLAAALSYNLADDTSGGQAPVRAAHARRGLQQIRRNLRRAGPRRLRRVRVPADHGRTDPHVRRPGAVHRPGRPSRKTPHTRRRPLQRHLRDLR